jgi:L-lactate permease
MQQAWQQLYDPAGNLWVSSLIALLPIAFFFVALAVLRMKGWLAGTLTVVIALAVALFFYRMPVDRALASAVYGFFYGLWPIAWIIVGAVFLYKVSVRTGQFDIIRSSILSVTEDQRRRCCWWASPSARSWKARPASARRWRSPPRCWSGWASARCTRPGCA